MKIGFDVDGVLADFCAVYDALIVSMTGEDKFPKDREYRTVWSYPEELCGYDKKDIDAVWKYGVKRSPTIWASLEPLPGAVEVIQALNVMALSGEHDIFFITHRMGVSPKLQTEVWLNGYGMLIPTVIVTSDKATAAKVCKLDCYIDDKVENANSVMQMVRNENLLTRVYMPSKPWNAAYTPDAGVKVVGDTKDMLLAEGVWPVQEGGVEVANG